MNEKSRFVLRIVAGLYVVYLGFQIISGVMKERPGNMVLLMIAGIFFIVAGGAIAILSLKSIRKIGTSQQAEADSEEGIEDDIEDNQEMIETEAADIAADTADDIDEGKLNPDVSEQTIEVIDEEEK